MNEEIKEKSIIRYKTDWVGIVIWLSILTLFVLFAGTPDLMDAIIYKLTGFKGW